MSEDLRMQIAKAMIADVSRQTDGAWPYDGDDGLCILVDAYLDFAQLADAILSLPALSEAVAISDGFAEGDFRDYLLRRGRWEGVSKDAGYV